MIYIPSFYFMFNKEQRAEVEVADFDISATLTYLTQRGQRLTATDIEQSFTATNHQHSAATLRKLLQVLRQQICSVAQGMSERVEFAAIVPGDEDALPSAEGGKTDAIDKLHKVMELTLAEIEFIRKCLMHRAEQERAMPAA